MADNNEAKNGTKNGLWIFGYGSLCWYPGFEYNRSMTGYVKGFGRKFWQGNTTHRGTAEKPGRVATLVEDTEGVVYGRAFEIKGEAAIPYLENRECSLGGYLSTFSTFYSRDGGSSFPVLVYIANRKNQLWLGEASLHSIATQITESSGPSGHNVEYLLRLADFMHRYLPEVYDEHLFTLEMLVRTRIKEQNMCLKTLMGSKEFHIDLQVEDGNDPDAVDNEVPNQLRENSFQYISRVPAKTLRCLKM